MTFFQIVSGPPRNQDVGKGENENTQAMRRTTSSVQLAHCDIANGGVDFMSGVFSSTPLPLFGPCFTLVFVALDPL